MKCGIGTNLKKSSVIRATDFVDALLEQPSGPWAQYSGLDRRNIQVWISHLCDALSNRNVIRLARQIESGESIICGPMKYIPIYKPIDLILIFRGSGGDVFELRVRNEALESVSVTMRNNIELPRP